MNLKNIDTSSIEKSIITVLYPFIYDEKKVLDKQNIDKLYKLTHENLKDFLPYTNNFFGNYHFKDTKEISLPCIIKDDHILNIDFIKDNKINTKLCIESNKIFFFEKSIAILSIEYVIPNDIKDIEFLYYHQKLSSIEKRGKQNLKLSNDKVFTYYFEFINYIIEPYCKNDDISYDEKKRLTINNLFDRSNLYTYNLLTVNQSNKHLNTFGFLEPLSQYRIKLDDVIIKNINSNIIQQTSNINTIANENVVAHIGIKSNNADNNFIEKEFFPKYNNNHFLTYVITLYQTSKLEQLILKAFLKEIDNEDLENMRNIKSEILHFISNGNFTKISNNSIRNNLYKFYRKSFEIKDLIYEIDTISDKLTNKLETIHQDRQAFREKILNLILALIGIGLSIVGLY